MHIPILLLSILTTALPFALAAPKSPPAPSVYSCYQCQSPPNGLSFDNDYYVTLPDGNCYCNQGFKPCAGVGTPSEGPGVTSHPTAGRCQMMLTQYADGTDATHGKFAAGFLDDKVVPMGNTPNMTLSVGEQWHISTSFGPTMTVWFEGHGLNQSMWFFNEFTRITYSTINNGDTNVVGTAYSHPGVVQRYWTEFTCDTTYNGQVPT